VSDKLQKKDLIHRFCPRSIEVQNNGPAKTNRPCNCKRASRWPDPKTLLIFAEALGSRPTLNSESFRHWGKAFEAFVLINGLLLMVKDEKVDGFQCPEIANLDKAQK
jgi:hypothetical protein